MTSQVRLVVPIAACGIMALLASGLLRHGVAPAPEPPNSSRPTLRVSTETPAPLPVKLIARPMTLGATALRRPDEVPAWAVPFGSEFWRSHMPASARLARLTSVTPFSAGKLADAIERVTHAFEVCLPRSNGGGGVRTHRPYREDPLIEAKAHGYRARLEASALTLAPGGVGQDNPLISVRTLGVSRSATDRCCGAAQGTEWCVVGNTAQRQVDPGSGLVEHYEIRSDGVELAWILGRPPSGAGDLSIEAEIAGAQLNSSWAEDSGGAPGGALPRCFVGPALAIDQTGRQWQIPLETSGQTFKARVPQSVLIEAQFPLVIDPLITPDFGMDAVTGGASPGTRAHPAIAANLSGYLLVWSQGKSEMGEAGVFAARITPEGALSDPYGFQISAQAAEQSSVAIAANDNLFLVAWSAPHGTSTTDWDILGARVSSSGVLLDAAPLPIITAASIQCSPAVAGNGLNFLVAWRDNAYTGIAGATVGADGTVSPRSVLLNATGEQYTPAVASLGTNYLVVAQDYRKATVNSYYSDIFGARVDGTGKLVDTNGFAICTNAFSQWNPAVTSDGTKYLVVWQDYDIEGSDLRAARVTPEGVVLDTNSFVICHAANAQGYPAVAAQDGTFFVLWQDYRNSGAANYEAQIYGARVSPEGSVLDPGGIALSSARGGQYYPALVAAKGSCVAVWQDFRNNPGTVLSDVYGAQLNAATLAPIRAESMLSGAPNAQVSPSIAVLGTNYLATWADNRDGSSTGWDICGARLDGNGTLLDPGALWICTATNRQADPAVAAGSNTFFVAWSDWRNTPYTMQQPDIYGTLISPEGKVQQPDGIPICTATNAQSSPAVAAFGTNFLVVWQDARFAQPPGSSRLDIYGARVAPTGDVLDAGGFPICTNVAIQTNPVVAATATRALVAWTDYRLNATFPDVYGARVNPDGAVVDTNGLPICNRAGSTQNLPAIATDGSGFLVVWADSRNGTTMAPDIFGAYVTDSGLVSPTNGLPIRTGVGPQTAPAVAFNGLDYLVSWQEAVNTTTPAGIYAVQVGNDSALSLGPLMIVETNLMAQTVPAVVASPDDRFLVLHEGSSGLVRRVTGNFVNSEAVPRLSGGTLSTTGFELRFRGALGETYLIETSEDLRVWSPLWRFTNSAPSSVLTDSGATNHASRYYRAVLIQ